MLIERNNSYYKAKFGTDINLTKPIEVPNNELKLTTNELEIPEKRFSLITR